MDACQTIAGMVPDSYVESCMRDIKVSCFSSELIILMHMYPSILEDHAYCIYDF